MDGSDNESDAGGERMLMPAFPVDDAPDFDPTAVPTSGEEFLRLVRYGSLLKFQFGLSSRLDAVGKTDATWRMLLDAFPSASQVSD